MRIPILYELYKELLMILEAKGRGDQPEPIIPTQLIQYQ